MRLSAIFIRIIAFSVAAAGSVAAAQLTVATVEDRSVDAVRQTLAENGHEWTNVLGDGLQVILEGTAPTEAGRFRAISAAGGVVDASRVIDNLSVADAADFAPPEFKIEILRNDSGVSLIGLIPASTNRDALARRITRIADGQGVADLLETGDYPTPPTWRAAVDFAIVALEMLPRSKISVTADRITISGIADNLTDKRRLEAALARSRPDGVRLALEINAPRPVISPFTARFILDADGARFDACAVDTVDARELILDAATSAGLEGRVTCTLALGAPSQDWGQAVALAIDALHDVGGGTVTLTDTDVILVALPGTEQGIFDNAIGELENSLPDVFALTAELPKLPDDQAAGPPQFTATLSPEGHVQLRGRMPDDLTNMVAENFATAKFGQRNITMRTRVVDDLPVGWSVRVLAGIEALSELSNGIVVVEPQTITVRGNTGNETATAEISRLMIDKLGQSADFDLDIGYVEALDPIAALPTPDQCIAQIIAMTDGRKITFDPGSASITAAAQPVIDDIAEVLRLCGDLRIRVAGYTDSQGREAMNLRLSQDRADAVLTALRARRVPVSTFEAVGYGIADPIADNATEAGREANRRIEFSLIVPEDADAVTDETLPEALETDAETAQDGAGDDAAEATQ
ncbi:OmpA family protein [Yoonia vestfoldensis]|jgi:OOP family OmpA-OmpF porin|uniref:OmpA domain protein n=1 Tax=Yoonia vestfoldensis SKA53 TaxID=314232 RepID=A3V4Z8_9RHOB|nr:OmpA family protein [Yoonia vestfoldensis]EAQ06716.1 OmpA domain protein [Yoonia vestfoldensis SKA53]